MNSEDTSNINDTNKAKRLSVVYYTSWGISNLDFSQLSPNISHLNLSFGLFSKVGANFVVSGSDGLLKYNSTNSPVDLWWVEPEYLGWVNYKYKNPKTKVMLSLGGASYGYMWEYLNSASNVDGIVAAIQQVLQETYPVVVRKSPSGGQYSLAGYVHLDGIDFDFEMGHAPSEAQCKNLALLIEKLKLLMPNKLISVTALHVAADPKSCSATASDECSYVGSAHSGELIPFFHALKNRYISHFNVMAYDAGKNYRWDIALANYAKFLPKKKIVLGLSLGSQWAAEGNFVEGMTELTKRVDKQKSLGYAGIMIWALVASGVSDKTCLTNINSLVNHLNTLP